MEHWLITAAKNKETVLAGCRWRRCKHDAKTYELVYERRGYRLALGKVWRNGARCWSGLSGHSAATLKEIQTTEADALAGCVVTRMEELLARLAGLTDGATQDADFEVSLFEAHVFESLLNAKVTSLARGRIAVEPDWLEQPEGARLGNALVAVERGPFHFSILSPRACFGTAGTERRVLKLNTLIAWSSMLRECQPKLFESDQAFGDNGRLEVSVPSLDERCLATAVDSMIDQALQHAASVDLAKAV